MNNWGYKNQNPVYLTVAFLVFTLKYIQISSFLLQANRFPKRLLQIGSIKVLFPKCTFITLTATASLDSIQFIKSSLNMFNYKIIRASPNRRNVFLAKKMRGDSVYGVKSYDRILVPVAKNLKIHRRQSPQTLVYMKLKYCAYTFKFFKNITENIYEGENKTISNSLVAQFHTSQTDLMKQEIIKELLKQNSKIRVVFPTSALSMGVYMPYITRIIHIAPPASREEYVQEVGRAGRSGLQAYAYLYYCNSDISDHRSKKGYITKPMIEYCKSNACLREHLLQRFGFKITIKQSKCCSFCQAEFQEDEMLHTVVFNENVRAIDRGNLEILTAKFNDLSAEKDTSTSISSMSSVILGEAEKLKVFQIN